LSSLLPKAKRHAFKNRKVSSINKKCEYTRLGCSNCEESLFVICVGKIMNTILRALGSKLIIKIVISRKSLIKWKL
jgi:hypothetical protein